MARRDNKGRKRRHKHRKQDKRLLLPLSPFERRMASLPLLNVPPENSLAGMHLKHRMRTDIAFQLSLQRLERELPCFAFVRGSGGSGLLMADTVRMYFMEFLNRLCFHGPDTFPLSFNVVEAFLEFVRSRCVFDLRYELEHLLSVDDYFRWHESAATFRKPAVLLDAMKEGVNYSFNMINEANGLRLSCGESMVVIGGVSLVRHGHELSSIVVAGESPPDPTDEDAAAVQDLAGDVTEGRGTVTPDPTLGIRDRDLPGFPGHARVIMLTRINLRTAEYDVRYVNRDIGDRFDVLTDDLTAFDGIPDGEWESTAESSLNALGRYDELFSAAAAMIYLPVAFIDESEKVRKVAFSTLLGAEKERREVQEAIALLGAHEIVLSRDVKCLAVRPSSPAHLQQQHHPPELQFKTEGYWRPTGAGEVGEDKEGNPVVGRTWVSRTESWSARPPGAFLAQQREPRPSGPDPGVVYVLRSSSHHAELYKIGMTRRSSDVRAKEIGGATGVPLPFGVLASWDVGDCAAVEKEVHRRLRPYRINPRREFFMLALSEITQVINGVVTKDEDTSEMG